MSSVPESASDGAIAGTLAPGPAALHFLSAAEPLPLQAARWLAAGWSGSGPLDLRSTLILVPTQGAGRRLRQALAHIARRDDGLPQGVLTGPVLTPGAALKRLAADDRGETAPGTAVWLAYAAALLQAGDEEITTLFPARTLRRSATWAMQTAAMLIEVRELLAESGADAATVVASGQAAALGDGDRWQVLQSIEHLARRELDTAGWADPLVRQRQAIQAGQGIDGIERVVIVAVPDPVELARQWWEALAKRLPVEVLVYAPEGLPEQGRFDRWGRPEPDDWETVPLPWEQWPCGIELWSHPAAAGRHCAEVVRAYGDRWPQSVAIAVPDATMAGDIAAGMAEGNVRADDLQGQGWNQHPWRHLVQRLTRVLESASARDLAELARCRPVVNWLQRQLPGFAPGTWLSFLAKVAREALPAGSDDWVAALARELEGRRQRREASALAAAPGDGKTNSGSATDDRLERMRQAENACQQAGPLLVGRLGRLNSPADLAEWLSELACGDSEGEPVAEQAHAMAGLLDRVGAGPLRDGLARRPAALMTALAGHLQRCGVFALHPEEGSVPLNGWLETLWEDAPHLLLTGLQEGAVPETVTGHPFLPEGSREQLGLKTNRRRHARDAYLLACAVCGRGPGGRTDIALIKRTTDGDPLKPSRLLFQGEDQVLPARVERLFGPPADHASADPPSMPWQLRPELAKRPEKISVTAFSDYLRCPFRFYLKQVLRMRAEELDRLDLDPMQFGNVIHHTWERFSANDRHLDLTDPQEVGAALMGAFEEVVSETFGARPPVAVQVQLGSARNRLLTAASHQAAARAAGWRIIGVEQPLEFKIGGLTVRGKIDRTEQREVDGVIEFRVIDYKSSDKSSKPDEAHAAVLGSRSDPSRYSRQALASLSGGDVPEVAWKNLQLPLYVEQLRRQHGDQVRVRCGYFNLPKAAAEAGICEWTDYDHGWHRAAMTCAEGVVDAIQRGVFWPPSTEVKSTYDEFSDLILDSLEDSVAADWHATLQAHWQQSGQAAGTNDH